MIPLRLSLYALVYFSNFSSDFLFFYSQIIFPLLFHARLSALLMSRIKETVV